MGLVIFGKVVCKKKMSLFKFIKKKLGIVPKRSDFPTTLVFIPSLVAILVDAEKTKGSPLTENEVISIRDSSTTMEIALELLPTFEESRGYRDIDPENCWNEWQEIRIEFNSL